MLRSNNEISYFMVFIPEKTIEQDLIPVCYDSNRALLELEYVPNTSDNGVGEEYLNPINGGDASSPNFQLCAPNFSSNHPDEPPPSNIPSNSFDSIMDEDSCDDDLGDDSDLEGNTSGDSDIDSDVHQEYIDIRTSKRHFNRSQRRSRGTINKQINVDEKGPGLEYNETNVGTTDSLVGKLGGNEPYYKSDEAPSFELDDEVGRTTVRRARSRVLQEIMGDHIVEYGSIFYYRNKILRTNSDNTCVVKVGDADETGQLIFQNFYVCFHALKKTLFGGARRLIGLDDCFLKGVCKGQLLVAICRDKNNQILSIAWAVLEDENQFTWGVFEDMVKKYLEEHCNCDVVDNNMVESFNAWVLPARFKMIITMLEEIRDGASTGRERGRARSSGPSHAAGTSYQQEPRMPSRRVISTGAKVTKSSDIVTGDIGYTPRQGFKWKGKSVIINSKLKRMRAEKVIQTRSAASVKTQGKNSLTRKTHMSWK
ncbi:putative enzymatic polyprotein-like [Capsicum annuum]|nr:putative enzymatic polyprotein-like [Capsicum annuum]